MKTTRVDRSLGSVVSFTYHNSVFYHRAEEVLYGLALLSIIAAITAVPGLGYLLWCNKQWWYFLVMVVFLVFFVITNFVLPPIFKWSHKQGELLRTAAPIMVWLATAAVAFLATYHLLAIAVLSLGPLHVVFNDMSEACYVLEHVVRKWENEEWNSEFGVGGRRDREEQVQRQES